MHLSLSLIQQIFINFYDAINFFLGFRKSTRSNSLLYDDFDK